MKKAPLFLTLSILMIFGLIYIVDSSDFWKDTNSTTADPQGYIDYYLMRRGGKIDPSTMAKSFADTKSFYNNQKKNNYKDAGLLSWEWKGPGNIGGRVRALAVKDNGSGQDELFAGSSGGGMLHSTDAGATWSYVNDFLPSLVVTCIVIDPTDDNRIYAATGDGFGGSSERPGAGIMFSADGGENWGVLPGTSEWYYINRIALDPNDHTTIYAVRTLSNQDLSTNTGGRIEKSTTVGLTWEAGWTTQSNALDIEINPDNSEQVFVGCSNHVYKSVVTGGVWDFINIPELFGLGRCELAFAPSLPIKIHLLSQANNGTMYQSFDSGDTWMMRDSSTDMGMAMWHYNSLFVNPTRSYEVIAGGVDVYRSMDNATTFTTISNWKNYHNGNSAHADHHIFVPSINYTDTTPIVYSGNDGGVQRIDNIWTDGKNDWTNLANGTFGVTQFYGADAKKDGTLFLAGSQDNSFAFGSNATNWIQPITGDGAQTEINYNNEQIMYANLNENTIKKTTDGGLTWNTIAVLENTDYCINHPENECCQDGGPGINGTVCIDENLIVRIDDDAPLISEFIMDPDNPEILYAGGQTLWKINDDPAGRSVTFLTASGGVVTTIAAADNGQTIWSGFSLGALPVTFNSGTSWTDFSSVFDFCCATYTDIEIDPQNSSRILVSRGGYIQENLFIIDVVNQSPAESTITDISLPFAMQINTVAFHPTKTGWLYIGTDVGVFASEDDGKSWSITPIYDNIQGGHPNEGPIYSVVEELFWYGDGSAQYPYHLGAATFGRGVWATTAPVFSHLYVDKNYAGIETGSFTQPFNTLLEAKNAAAPGITIVFKSAGNHDEPVAPIFIDSRMKIEVSNGAVVIE